MTRYGFIILGVILGTVALANSSAMASNPPLNLLPPEALCRAEITDFEQEYQIPKGLLHTISLMESGRYQRAHKAVMAWPWTVMAEGRGRYLNSKAEAIAEVRALQAKGVRNIDVGCMQINLRYHPKAFRSLEEAFDPSANVGYSARFLVGLFKSAKNWLKAGSYYHSQTPHRAAAYQAKLEKIWKKTLGQEDIIITALKTPPKIQQDLGKKALEQAMIRRQNALEEKHAQQAEARAIAKAWRQARLTEYSLRRQWMEKRRSVAGLNSR